MSDLIERLKQSDCRLCLDAWDEIERLNKDIDGLMELLRREKARVEALERM